MATPEDFVHGCKSYNEKSSHHNLVKEERIKGPIKNVNWERLLLVTLTGQSQDFAISSGFFPVLVFSSLF